MMHDGLGVHVDAAWSAKVVRCCLQQGLQGTGADVSRLPFRYVGIAWGFLERLVGAIQTHTTFLFHFPGLGDSGAWLLAGLTEGCALAGDCWGELLGCSLARAGFLFLLGTLKGWDRWGFAFPHSFCGGGGGVRPAW
jgi:hypothetical protein